MRHERKQQRVGVVVGHHGRFINFPQNLVRSVGVHVVVGVPLNPEQGEARLRVPTVLLVDRLVNASLVFPSE